MAPINWYCRYDVQYGMDIVDLHQRFEIYCALRDWDFLLVQQIQDQIFDR